jgi:polysaccharide export outer membrane protein
MRVTEARRSVLFSSTRYLQTTSQLGHFRKELGEVNRRLEKAHDTRKTELLKEYQEAIVKSNTTSAKIKSTLEKLAYAGGARSLLSGRMGDRPTITIVRESNGDITKIAADEDAELKPGDVVEAAVKMGQQEPTAQVN